MRVGETSNSMQHARTLTNHIEVPYTIGLHCFQVSGLKIVRKTHERYKALVSNVLVQRVLASQKALCVNLLLLIIN
jgi:hypothetical protein